MTSLLDRLKGEESSEELDDYSELPDDSEWDGLLQDPPPAATPQQRSKRPSILPPPPSGPALKLAERRRIAAELEAYGYLLVMPLQIRDPVCGEVARETIKPAADALTGILARYPDLAAKFLATGVFGDWIKLVAVLKPLAEVVYHHHIAKDHPALDDQESDVDLNAYPAFSDRPGR